MFAVIEAGGKQHKVKEGEILKLEKIEKGIGESVDFDKVLMVINNDKTEIGTPYLDGKTVTAEVLEQGRHKKVKIIKFKRRKHHMKRQGHRQYFTSVKITKIA